MNECHAVLIIVEALELLKKERDYSGGYENELILGGHHPNKDE